MTAEYIRNLDHISCIKRLSNQFNDKLAGLWELREGYPSLVHLNIWHFSSETGQALYYHCSVRMPS